MALQNTSQLMQALGLMHRTYLFKVQEVRGRHYTSSAPRSLVLLLAMQRRLEHARGGLCEEGQEGGGWCLNACPGLCEEDQEGGRQLHGVNK